MAKNSQKVSDAQLKEALKQAAGSPAAAAEILVQAGLVESISRQTIWERIQRSAELREACEEAEETTIDLAEYGLARKVRKEDMNAIRFVLETKGKSRGYVRRNEVTGKGGGPIQGEQRITVHAPELANSLRNVPSDQRLELRKMVEGWLTDAKVATNGAASASEGAGA